MVATFHFGSGTSCQLELDDFAYVRPASHESISPQDLAEHVRAAFKMPVGYPPLAEAAVPGDQVVVALRHGLPLLKQILAGASAALRDAGVEPSQATFLCTPEMARSDSLLEQLAAENDIQLERHDPTNIKDCAFFGVTQSGQGLRMNRKLCDADVVLPIGLTTIDLADQQCDKYGGLFPHFCDEETIARYHDCKKADSAKHRENRRREIDESGWLLGVGMTVQVVPGAGGTVAAVLAGEPTAVAQAATEKYRQVWSRPVAARGDLVIATITGPTGEQSWDNFARALTAAQSVLEPGGAIAICSELANAPGPSLRRLLGSGDYARLERKLQRDRFADSRTALLVCRALEQGPVYLHSQLDANVVEGLGLAPIESDAELLRLAKSYRCPVVLEDAHRLLPTLSEQSL
jgi:nickel-dependent lactate racemase